MQKIGLIALFGSLSLGAQMPPNWNAPAALGQPDASTKSWYGVGLWSADQHGPTATLVDSLGLGNGLTGNGIHLEAGLRTGSWDLAAQALAGRDSAGGTFLTLFRGHATWRSREKGGWELGLEREPLVWGYGLNGGYLLGSAARPFPRFRVESPMVALHLWRVPLGTWGFQAFMGRLESRREFSSSLQNPLERTGQLGSEGDPQAPLFNGYRIQATFGENMEFYANYTNLWGGSVRGKSFLSGYSASEYLTAMFGLKDTLAEANADPDGPPVATPYKNEARSASNADLGFRLRIRRLEELWGAETVHAYLARGSKNVWWNPGVFFRNPVRYLAKDVSTEARRLVQGRLPAVWNNTGRYAAPNLASPNDTLGLLVAWSRLRLGLEYEDTVNNAQSGVRSFGHYLYLSGFYTHGDPLGNAIGGEARTTTARLEVDWNPRLKGTTVVHLGHRPFRDRLAAWQEAYPGLSPVKDRFVGLQQGVQWQVTPLAALGTGASWQRHSAVANAPGHSANGFRYYADLSFRWPAR